MQQKASVPIIVVAAVALIGLLVFMYSKFFAPPPSGSTPAPQWVEDLKKGAQPGAGSPGTGGSMGSGPGGRMGGSMGGSPGMMGGSMGGSMGMGGTMGGGR